MGSVECKSPASGPGLANLLLRAERRLLMSVLILIVLLIVIRNRQIRLKIEIDL